MKADKFIVQSYDGGPEYEFFVRTPFYIRSDIALSRIAEFKSMPPMSQANVRAIAQCILAVQYEGKAAEMDAPDTITIDNCLEFASRYRIDMVSDVELSKVADENPTVTRGERS